MKSGVLGGAMITAPVSPPTVAVFGMGGTARGCDGQKKPGIELGTASLPAVATTRSWAMSLSDLAD